MKSKFYPLVALVVILSVGITSCKGEATQPPATEPPATEVVVTEAPATEALATEAPTEPPPTLEPINLAGPPMEVGSKYLYADGSVLVAVPTGEFIMGQGRDDNPEHTVFLDEFWIYRAPVTNQQYALCVNAGMCDPPDLTDNAIYNDPYRANDPVVGVNWSQAEGYCTFMQARLPSEAEWEKTARGPDGNIYPWGNGAPSCDLLNAADCVSKTTDVTEYPQGASYYEALDTAGNVFEWVADWYSPIYYAESPTENPLGPDIGNRRSIRSSGFSSTFFETEVARRFNANPIDYRADLGFRCVVEDPMIFAPYCEQMVVYGVDANGLDPVSKPNIINTCPSLSISQSLYCGANNTPLTNVQFGVNPPVTSASIDAGSCTDLGGNAYLCTDSVQVSICADCTQTINESPHCPLSYHLDGNTCIPDTPFDGRCVPGFNYDPVKMCCSAQAGGLPGGSNPCPAGTYYYNPPGGCFAIPGAGTLCEMDMVAFKKCGGGGGPGDDPGDGDCPPGSSEYCPPGAPCYCR